MRIAYILTSLGIGGAEKQVVALAEQMSARGHSVILLVLREPQPNQWPTTLPVHHLRMRKSPLAIVSALLRARRVLRTLAPDLLHSHTFPANLTARVLRLLGAAPDNLSTIHNVYEGGLLRMVLYRLTDPLSLHTTAVSAAVAGRFIRIHAVPARKCTVVSNAISLGQFTPNPIHRSTLRAQFGGSPGFLWIAVGRIAPAKDYSNLLHAFAHALDSEPHAELWIVGEASDPAEARHVRKLVADLHVENRTKCLGLRRDIPDLLGAADGYVLSSAWEGMPLVVGEAMAMEKPVVATDVGGVGEIVGDCGTIVPAKNPAALANAMLATMRMSESDRLALGRAARARIAAHFSFDVRACKWDELYRALLSPRLAHDVPKPA
jgi:glycosyltransferase involved in cell wall biosynthesis